MTNDVSRDDLRNRTLEYLRKNSRTQLESLLQFGIETPLGRRLSQSESQTVLEILHELTTSNIVMPAADRLNSGWPWFGLTKHGEEVLAASGPPVYDYDGYMAHLRTDVGTLDAVIERFVGEALRAYQRHLYLASMAMLGCASERAIWLLINAYLASISNETNREKLRSRVSGRDISVAYARFRESFKSVEAQLPAALHIEFDLHVDQVFTFTRLIRNAVLHPTTALPTVTHAVVYASLQQFSYYVPTIRRLSEHFASASIQV